MTTFRVACEIPSDPDISGIGVRSAIYAQNLLCFVPAVWALWDGKVSSYELDSIETQSTSNLIIAFAILISAIVQARTLGLSNYHASIVLDLSWMNNTVAFVYFLLYVQHKRQPEHGIDRVEPTWAAWTKHLKRRIQLVTSYNVPIDLEKQKTDPSNKGMKLVFRRIVLVLGSLHLTIMATLGIWLWSNPRSFGTASSCVADVAHVVILGNSVTLGSKTLRICSLAIYSFFLTPGLNLLFPMTVFLGIFLGYQVWYERHQGPRDITNSNATGAYSSGFYRSFRRLHPTMVPIFFCLSILFIVNLIFIVDIELTLRRNRDLQRSDESKWGFGQILAILLLVLPLRDLVETILSRREMRRKDEHTASLQAAIKARSLEVLIDLIDKGADVNIAVESQFTVFSTALTLAASEGREGLVTDLLSRGADPNAYAPGAISPLEAATSARKWGVIHLLIKSGADPNVVFESKSTKEGLSQTQAKHLGSVLQRAAYHGQIDTVKLLLEHKADPNLLSGDYGTSLQAAAYTGELGIVTLLLEHGANPNLQGGLEGTALQAAAGRHSYDIVKVLFEHGADVNIRGGACESALQAAAYSDYSGKRDLVQYLLERNADPNFQGGLYGTALHAACFEGNADVVQLLLEYEADPNIQAHMDDPRCSYGSPLHVACFKGGVDVVRLLLKHAADPNIIGQHGTALQSAYKWGKADIACILLEHGAYVSPLLGDASTVPSIMHNDI